MNYLDGSHLKPLNAMSKPTVTVKEDLLEYMTGFEVPVLSALLKDIVLDYLGKQVKGGLNPSLEQNLEGIVKLLEYLDYCEKEKEVTSPSGKDS